MVTSPATHDSALGRGRLSVVVAACGFAVLALALLPVASRPAPALPGIVALFVAVIFVTELSTSFLLLVRFRAAPSWSVLVLGCAYLYSGLMLIPHLLTFPGAVLANRPLIGASAQSASWLYILWTNGFALLGLLAVSLEARAGDRRIAPKNVRGAVVLGLGLTAVTTLAAVLVAIVGPDRLPTVVEGARFTALSLLASYLAVVLLIASIAVVLIALDGRDQLFLWLALALTAVAFANIVSTSGGGRFTVGFSACVLFIYLMIVHARDQHLWSHARDLLRAGAGDAAAQQITPDAIPSALEAFVMRQNIMRYRRMLEEAHDEAYRQVLQRMLADEERRLEQFRKSRP
jgi:hypothetical protein